jgi:hypothetical protein
MSLSPDDWAHMRENWRVLKALGQRAQELTPALYAFAAVMTAEDERVAAQVAEERQRADWLMGLYQQHDPQTALALATGQPPQPKRAPRDPDDEAAFAQGNTWWAPPPPDPPFDIAAILSGRVPAPGIP